MELPEPSERKPRPELDRARPARLFAYAQEKQRWLRASLHEQRLPDEIDHLIDELELYRLEAFQGESALINVTAQDITYTRRIDGNGSRFSIETAPLPKDDERQIFGMQGELYRFHRGSANDVRAYMSVGEQEREMPGGIFVPLLSVGVEDAEIEFVKYSTSEKIYSLTEAIAHQLPGLERSVDDAVFHIVAALNDEKLVAVKKLHLISPLVQEIAKVPAVTTQFLDTLLDMITLKMELYDPHTIQTSSHRVVMTEQPVRSYHAQGAGFFQDVVPQLGISGETVNRWLGLFFIHDEKTVQVPVHYITTIHKTK